jgi:hypothetical protein
VNTNFAFLLGRIEDNAAQIAANTAAIDDAEAVLASGESPGTAATSCQAILDAGVSSGDGTYWLDPEDDGVDPFLAWCDMDGTEAWVLLGTMSNDDADRWDWATDVWRDGSTLVSGDPASFSADYKGEAWARLPVDDLRIDFDTGARYVAPGCLGGTAIGDFFAANWTAPQLSTANGAFGEVRDCALDLVSSDFAGFGTPFAQLGDVLVLGAADNRTDGDRMMIGVITRADYVEMTGAGYKNLGTSNCDAGHNCSAGADEYDARVWGR